MAENSSIDELVQDLESEPIQVVTLLRLREIFGYKRLGNRVLVDISKELANRGLGYFPREILDANEQPRQWEELRIFRKQSPVGKLVTAVLEPSHENDLFLKEASTNDETNAAAVLDQIRTLLGD
ncbi:MULTISPECIES: hypothetical protein [Paenarthrobacter]|uniref:Uncharacterized protein n=1 Tax=Paenarthrobacter ureafaciens TaxID=37931 RepID=A0AAX3EQT6_PAEUR|nr:MULTISPECIES: hypothetical protein [Paenarthrobacter]NKR12648.1 hypothetical protein [Arthrobacter sp. M5]NKR16507.1 hypothetical protein [Arthrobacter sp. M6]OEH60102.1 hypothetical protein A5N17_17370 [Arthrobacter sp. D2]OEH63738.1 hypothetical protein A5N13_14015 [Arthrobacter sp. D4]MDO5878268.1 hypothetical protein [Paenarthrobacter sp. SD-1]